jgi:hypothetical protein
MRGEGDLDRLVALKRDNTFCTQIFMEYRVLLEL